MGQGQGQRQRKGSSTVGECSEVRVEGWVLESHGVLVPTLCGLPTLWVVMTGGEGEEFVWMVGGRARAGGRESVGSPQVSPLFQRIVVERGVGGGLGTWGARRGAPRVVGVLMSVHTRHVEPLLMLLLLLLLMLHG